MTEDERELLEDCARGDEEARARFETVYENEIVRTVQEILIAGRQFAHSEDHVDAVVSYVIEQIYTRRHEFPVWSCPLREEVHKFASFVATRYRRTRRLD
jgi:hypothetical protein